VIVLHRYDYALSFERVSAACACEGYWPCDMDGHRTYDERDYDGDWRCVPDCQHPSHASEVGDWTEGPCEPMVGGCTGAPHRPGCPDHAGHTGRRPRR
jgi:hypothetical protein